MISQYGFNYLPAIGTIVGAKTRSYKKILGVWIEKRSRVSVAFTLNNLYDLNCDNSQTDENIYDKEKYGFMASKHKYFWGLKIGTKSGEMITSHTAFHYQLAENYVLTW